MKKYTLILALALILVLSGCSVHTPSDDPANSMEDMASVLQDEAESSATASNADPDDMLPPDSVPVSQEDEILPEEGPDPIQNPETQSRSGAALPETDAKQEAAPDRTAENREGSQTEVAGTAGTADMQEPNPNQPVSLASEDTAPEQQADIPSQAQEPEAPTDPALDPAPSETAKGIYDYEFDVEAIRAELIALGQSMGLTHITEDDGVPCTPDTCSWASPITASQALQGENLKRALQSYVSSMPSIVTSYGGSAISCFTIYVQDNGGGSYTFYFLY